MQLSAALLDRAPSNQKKSLDASLRTKEEHLQRLKGIENEHRMKLMELEEEKLSLQEEEVTDCCPRMLQLLEPA